MKRRTDFGPSLGRQTDLAGRVESPTRSSRGWTSAQLSSCYPSGRADLGLSLAPCLCRQFSIRVWLGAGHLAGDVLGVGGGLGEEAADLGGCRRGRPGAVWFRCWLMAEGAASTSWDIVVTLASRRSRTHRIINRVGSASMRKASTAAGRAHRWGWNSCSRDAAFSGCRGRPFPR